MTSKMPCRSKESHQCNPCPVCREVKHVYYNGFNWCDDCGSMKPKERKKEHDVNFSRGPWRKRIGMGTATI